MAKFPPNAEVVFKGERWKVWQWEQKLYDGSTAVFEGVSRLDTAKTIAEIDGKFVYTRQSQPHIAEPYLDLPGGVVEEGEDPLAAAKRELLEEVGLESDDWELLNFRPNPSEQIKWDVYIYLARNCRRAAAHLDSGEKIEVIYASEDEFVKLLPKLSRSSDIEKLRQKLEGKK